MSETSDAEELKGREKPSPERSESGALQAASGDRLDGHGDDCGMCFPRMEEEQDIVIEDSLYSWVVAFGAGLQFILMGGIHKSFGLMLATLARDRDHTAAELAVIPGLYFSFSFLLSPLCGAACRRFSERTAACFGALLSSVGFILSAFTTNIIVLYLTNGVIFGIGQAFANVPGTLIVSRYFLKRRGLANSLNAAAAGVGGVFFPILMEAMLETFGIQGTYLMLGAIHLHILVSAMLYRPPEKQRMIVRLERARRSRQKATGRDNVPDEDIVRSNSEKTNCATPLHDNHEHSVIPDRKESDVSVGRCTSGANDAVTTEDDQKVGLVFVPLDQRKKSATLNNSTVMLSQLSLVAEPAPAAPRSCWQMMHQYLDVHLLKDRLFLLTAVSVILFSAGLPHVCLLIPRHALELDISRARTANMIATIAPIDIISRLSFGALLDRNLFHKRYGFLLVCVVGASGILGLTFVTDYTGLFVTCCFIYAAVGGYFVANPVLLAEYFGIHALSSTLSLANMFSGIANLVAQPLCGKLKDEVGSFRPVFGLLAALMYLGGALFLLHPCVISVMKQSEEQRKLDKQPSPPPRIIRTRPER